MYRDIPSGAAMFPPVTTPEYVEIPVFIYPASEYVDADLTEEEEYILTVVLNRVYWQHMRITPFVNGVAAVNEGDINPPHEMRDEIMRGAEWALTLIRS